MGYLYLFLALTFGIIKAYCGKRSSKAASCTYNAILINSVRMILCVLIGGIIVMLGGVPSLALTTPKVILIALLCGLSTAGFTVFWLLAVHTNAYMIVEVFVMGGVVIPLTLSAVLYNERIGAIQIVGLILLVIAVYIMCTYQKAEKAFLSAKSFLILLLCAISSGLADFSQKLYIRTVENTSISLFNLYTYLFAAVALLSVCMIIRAKEKNENKLTSPSEIIKPILHYVVIMAACLFLNAYFKTTSAKYLDAILLYPLNQGCAVILSLVMSVFIFREKITVKGIIGIALAVISMILINVFIPN